VWLRPTSSYSERQTAGPARCSGSASRGEIPHSKVGLTAHAGRT